MLGFISETPKKLEGKKIDVRKLKKEINSLAGELKFLKGRIRDPELNKAIYRWSVGKAGFGPEIKEFSAVQLRYFKTKLRFNKLVTLRSLMRGRIHFHKNTKLYYLPGLSKEDLQEWTKDVRKEFGING